MKAHLVRHVSGVALHFPFPYAVISDQQQIGEIGRAQTAEKAERLCQALELLERFERGELVEREDSALQAASD
ncbi:hypothetical protein Q0M94_08530 [Deinococcus radiomollis]|uniref:hypothetical protein n=1 Tax=Deinococcus radiomollis TaxID=468916 RepID=UPI0038920740